MRDAPLIVRERLADLRIAAVPFEEAWPLALEAVRSSEWRTALEETRDAWAGAFHRAPPSRGEFAAGAIQDEEGEPIRPAAGFHP